MTDNDDDDDDDDYKPILVESPLKNNYKYYESRGDKDKKAISLVKQSNIFTRLSHI